VKLNLPNEHVEQNISVVLMNLSSLIANYIPQEQVHRTKEILFETCHSLLAIEGAPKDAIADSLFGFVSKKEHLDLCLEWAQSAQVTLNGAAVYELKQSHKHRILKVMHMSPSKMAEEKAAMLELIIGEDKSDLAENLRATCFSALPSAECKAQVWAEITNPNSTESLYMRRAKMGGFYSWDQMDLIEPYFDKFFEVLPEIAQKTTWKYLDTFFHMMLPTMQVKESHIVKLVALKNETPDSQLQFACLLQDGIEVLLRCKQIRDHH
jgi:aminopeptidase N